MGLEVCKINCFYAKGTGKWKSKGSIEDCVGVICFSFR